MKEKRKKLNTKKLFTYILGLIIVLYFGICSISYMIKTDRQVKNYIPQEKTIIIK